MLSSRRQPDQIDCGIGDRALTLDGRRKGSATVESGYTLHSKSTTCTYSTELYSYSYVMSSSYFVPRSTPYLLQTGYTGPCGNSFSYRFSGQRQADYSILSPTKVRGHDRSLEWTPHRTGTRKDGLIRANGSRGSSTQYSAGKGQHHGWDDRDGGKGRVRLRVTTTGGGMRVGVQVDLGCVGGSGWMDVLPVSLHPLLQAQIGKDFV